MKRKDRSSNFELLRIVAILLIISFHYVFSGGYSFDAEISFNKITVDFFTMVGELGVNLFILITGYFSVNSSEIKLGKIVLVIAEVYFYNVLSMILLSKYDQIPFTDTFSFKDIFPTVYGVYWFATAYVLVYLFSPYINKMLRALSEPECRKLLLTLVVCFSVIPTIFGMKYNDTETLFYYNRFAWMLVMYITGGYISLHEKKVKYFALELKKYLVLNLAYFCLVLVLLYIMERYLAFFSKFGILNATYFWRPNTIVTYIWSILVFLLFSRIQIKSTLINIVASTTFGIYLLHDGKFVYALFHGIFKSYTHVHSRYLILHIMLTSLIILGAGCCIDLLRQWGEKKVIKIVLYCKNRK